MPFGSVLCGTTGVSHSKRKRRTCPPFLVRMPLAALGFLCAQASKTLYSQRLSALACEGVGFEFARMKGGKGWVRGG
jgi:hypothetical protein